MYVAIASMCNRMIGKDFDKMVAYVDKKNAEGLHKKYFLLELDEWNYNLYVKNKSLQYCHPTIVYDPYNVGEDYLRTIKMYSNGFKRTFGSRSGDH